MNRDSRYRRLSYDFESVSYVGTGTLSRDLRAFIFQHGLTLNPVKYENFHSILDDPDIAECFLTLPNEECYLNLPNDSAVDSPLDIQTISEKQKEDTELVVHMNKHKYLYFERKLDGHKVICYSKDREQRQTNWRIALPKSMIKSIVQWYHIVTRLLFPTSVESHV